MDSELLTLWHGSANLYPLHAGKIKLVGFPISILAQDCMVKCNIASITVECIL